LSAPASDGSTPHTLRAMDKNRLYFGDNLNVTGRARGCLDFRSDSDSSVPETEQALRVEVRDFLLFIHV